MADGNGPSRHASADDRDVGVSSFWDEAPAGVDRVRVRFRGTVFKEPVTDGAYLFVWFRQPATSPPSDWAREVAFRVSGEWVDVG